jgi:hypothetical protein
LLIQYLAELIRISEELGESADTMNHRETDGGGVLD